MHKVLIDVCEELNKLSELVLNSYNDDQILKNTHGWNHPALTRHDLAAIPKNIAINISKLEINEIDEDLKSLIVIIPDRLKAMSQDTISYMFNGNGNQAIPMYLATLEWVEKVIAPLFSWEVLQNTKALPPALNRRLRNVQTELDSLIPNKDALSEQIELIKEATEAAESLPTDLKSLKEARLKISEIEKESSFDRKKVTEHKASVESQLKSINDLHDQAEKLVSQCEEAYRITTTKGLAAAFDQRAIDLKNSMRCWVAGLFIALGVGAWIGAQRVESLSKLLSTSDPQWGIILMQLILSVTSVVAPLWFAWLATKQIGQRFRLAEDYGFKASVAKAYEGYKKEAAKIDKEFEARLFNVASTRLEEAPLRLLDDKNHGSPSHEFLEATGMMKIGERISNSAENVVEKVAGLKLNNDKLDDAS